METIFENIGFKITCESDVYRMADYVLNAGKLFPVKDGAYAFWTDESGAEVWLRLGHDHENKTSQLLNIDPHFHGGSSVWDLRMREELSGERDDILDGKFILESLDESRFFAVRIMGVKALRELKVGGEYTFQVAMIPHGVKFFESEDAYRSYYSDEKTVFGEFFPRGVYSRRLGGEEIKREEILLTGLVGNVVSAQLKDIKAAQGENKLGWFWHVRVETAFGTLDVPVAAEEDKLDYMRHCFEGGQAVVSLFGTMGALIVRRTEKENQE